MTSFFKLEENNTTVSREVIAGITTFFAMAYIMFVNPAILSQTGMPYQGVFIATCLAVAVASTAIGLIANVPYALGPGMGLNAFFTYTVVFQLGFTWQEALALVFICGLFNILITVTKLRQVIIRAIPEQLQHAISGGIGIFVAYIGLKNANIIDFLVDGANIKTINGEAYNASQDLYTGGIHTIEANGGVLPALSSFTDPMVLVAIAGLIITAILILKKFRGAMLIGIVLTTILAWLVDPTPLQNFTFANQSLGSSFADFGTVFGAALGGEGMGSLLANPARYPLILITIFALSLSDIFDTIGTFIGTGLSTGIFSQKDIENVGQSSGYSKMDRALFGDAIGTSIGAVLGTSNTTTFVESAAGIGAGGRTGLTSLSTSICFILAIFLAPFVSLVPTVATTPALIVVGIQMLGSFRAIKWDDFEVAIPVFFTSIFMGLAYSISYGIAAGFIAYIVVKLATGKRKEIHWVIWLTALLFIINFIILAAL